MADAQIIIGEARGFANDAYSQALPLVERATSSIDNMRFIGMTGSITTPPPPELPDLAVSLDLQPIRFEPGAMPADPGGYTAIPEIDAGQVPVNTAVKPVFTAPSLPAPLADFSATLPNVQTDFTFPDAPPQRALPDAPVIVARTAPTAPAISLPVFDGTKPADLPDAPTDYAQQFEAAYRGIGPTMRAELDGQVDAFLAKINPRFAQQMGALEDKLAGFMAGGTALTPQVENAIYERTARKVDAEYRRTRDAALSDAAKRGFTMPDGALFSAMRQARQDGANNNTLAAAEIAIKQAELEQQNVQFAVTTSVQLRTAVLSASLNYHGNLVQINGQALDYAKSILSAMIEVYNTLVKAYTAALDGYKAEASVYEARMRGALALVEIYKAEIAAFTALTEADMAKVKVFQAQIESLQSLAAMYRTQVEAVVAKASLEKLKIELFGAQVSAYESQAKAKSSEYQGYSAAISGEEGKLRAYSEEVRAHGADTETFRALVAAKVAEVNAAEAFNRGITSRYQGQLDAYKVGTQAQGSVMQAQVETQKSQLVALQAHLSAQETNAKIGLAAYQTESQVAIESFRAESSNMLEGAKISLGQMKNVADVALSGAQVYQGLASAALSGINTLVSQSLTE